MNPRRFGLAACLFLGLVPALHADTPAEPCIVVRLSSLHDLFSDIKYVARLEKNETQAEQIDKFVDSFVGKDYGGIETKKPAGVYCTTDPNDPNPQPIVLVPIANEKRFIEFLERYLGKAEKDADGIYRLGNFQWLHFMFDKGYAIASHEKRFLKSRPDPAKALASDRKGTLLIVARLDRLANPARDAGLSIFKQVLLGPGGGGSAEPELAKKLREQVVASVNRKVELMLKEGKEMVFQLGIDRQTEDLYAEWNLTAKPGTSLAKDVEQLGKVQSRFGAASADATAMGLQLHWSLPTDLTEAVRPIVDESIRRIMLNAAAETVRRQAGQLVESLDPTLRAGELDAGIRLLGGGGDRPYTLTLGMRLKNGLAIDNAVRSLVKSLPERDQEKFKFDAARAERGAIHRADLQHDFNEQFIALFGSNPIYYTIRADALWLALGPDALPAIKKSLAAPPQSVPPLEYELSFARLIGLMTSDKETVASLMRGADEAFGKKGGRDKMHVRLEGGQTLRARFTMKAPVVTFLKEADNRRVRPFWLYWWW